ncbi:MAG TPA: hypothetical protein VKA55_10525 [Gammaproteobacteria bacterium]|nr:hypothetical protein [Gammaproteobacteria bacterium]
MRRAATRTAALLLVLAAAPAAAQQAGGDSGGGSSVTHLAVVGAYDYWLGQDSHLKDSGWGYGATLRYLSGGMPLGFGVTWMRNKVDISGTYRADGHAFTNRLTMDRLGADLYYPMAPNARGNVPYLLAGGGRMTTDGDLAGGGSATVRESFWEAGMGIVNGGSRYTAFALELKYVAPLQRKVRKDDGMIELSMSVGYNL